MRLLITSFPGYGHLCPLIPLAQAASRAGHQVAIATSSRCADLLERAGLTLLPAGPDWHESDFDHDLDLAEDNSGQTRLMRFLNTVVYPEMVGDVIRHVRAWRPDILLANDYEPVGRSVAELEALPFVAATHNARLSPFMRRTNQALMSVVPRELCGLPAIEEAEYPMRWLHLNFTPQRYAIDHQTAESAANNEYCLRPQIFDAFEPPDDLEILVQRLRDKREPVVLCTLGTVFNKNPHVLGAVLAACAGQPYQVLLTLGPGFDPALVRDLPPNITVYPQLPLARIVPLVDLCICHGGTSTLLSILEHGKPLLLIPQGADQWLNAAVCNYLRIGISLSGDLHRQLETEAARNREVLIRNSVRTLLEDATYRQQAEMFQGELQQLPDLEYAVAILEKLHLMGMPVLKNR